MSKGRQPLPWIKLWFDILNDAKISRLSIAEKWCWVGMLLLAGQSSERGKLLLTDTEPMTIDDIANALHLMPEEKPALESCISKLTALKSLKWNSHCLEVIHFKDRQEAYPSDFKDYHKKAEKTPDKVLINSALSPDSLHKEGEGNEERGGIIGGRGERREERREKRDLSISSNEEIVSSSPERIPYQKIIELYNRICVSLPKVKTVTEARKRKIRHRWLTADLSLDGLEEIFQKVEASDFLSGRSGKWAGCNFDWIFQSENTIARIREGVYDNRAITKAKVPLPTKYKSIEDVLRERGDIESTP